MAIDKRVTEIADSDEEPMTSSPSADPCDATAVDKPPDANTAAENTAGAYVHGMGAPLDIDATNIHRIDMKPKDTVPAQEGTVPGPSHDDGSTSHVPAAHNGMERRASSTEEAQSSTVTKASSGTSAQDGSLESAHNTTSTIDPQTQHRQALARQDHVMSNASQTRSKDISNDSTRQNPEPVHPSDDAVHKSRAMPASISDATRTLAARANSKSTTPGPTGSDSVVLGDELDTPPHPNLSEIQDQESQMSAGNCGAQTVLQDTSPFIPQPRNLQGETNIRSLSPQEDSPPEETTGSSLKASDAAPKSTCRHQSPTGTSPTVARICPKTPQEITLSELKAQKAALLESLRTLPAIQVLIEELASSDAGADGESDEPTEADIMAAANKIVKGHIKLLHEYNELKDVGQGLMGLIADQRAVRIVEVQAEFGVDAED